MRQKAMIARALAGGAEVFIMDEPTSELDEQSEKDLLGHLFRLSSEQGKTVLLDPSAVATVFFGPAQVVLDEYSNGKSLSGAAEICTFNFADLAVLRPAHVVVGAA